MSTSRGELIAGIGGAVLIFSLFLPWFGDVSGWEGQSSTDIYMLITGGMAIASAVGLSLKLPGSSMNGAVAVLGAVAVILLLWLVFFDFPDGVDRGAGIIIALLAASAISYGANQAGR